MKSISKSRKQEIILATLGILILMILSGITVTVIRFTKKALDTALSAQVDLPPPPRFQFDKLKEAGIIKE